MLPFVYINVATTADGKLAPANRRFVAFSSKRDQRLLLELRARADAVMAGARTVDLVPANLGPGPAIFRRRFSPIIVLACGRAPQRNIRRLEGLADEVAVFGERELDFAAALAWLRKKWKVKRLLCEGGGEVNAGLFRAGLVDEIYQTICPVVFGGRHAPTMADGVGVQELAQATQLRLKSLKRLGQELFLVY